METKSRTIHSFSFLACLPSTAVLLAQAPYQEPFRFLGEFFRTLALMAAALNICSPLLSDASPSLEDQLVQEFFFFVTMDMRNCMFFRKHLAFQTVEFLLL